MSHSDFLSLVNDLDESHSAVIDLEEGRLFVTHTDREDEWTFSMKVLDMEDGDKELLSCFFSSGCFRFSDRDVVLRWDPHSQALYAVQTVKVSWKHYLLFRSKLNSFLDSVSEYRG